MKKINKKIIPVLLTMVVFGACKKGLDYQNTNAINPSNVWSDSNMIKAYVSDIYGGSMPGWPLGSGANSDEGIGGNGVNLSSYLQGVISSATTFSNLSYTNIDKANYFLDQVATVPNSVLLPATKARLMGEAKFWRAWSYWGMVSQIGGVPLILHTQDPTNPSSLKVPRNKTSDCLAQILKDLDSAAMALPASYGGNDYGRITSIAALGLKGRVLLWYASPLFNTTNDQTRWQNAYNATKAAVDAANADGYGVLSNYRNIWYSQNKEQIMVNQYYYPDHYMNFAAIRAESFSNGASNADQPLLSLLVAYPKKDGSSLGFDKTQLGNATYNAQLLTDFYTNRDDRFYATIYCGGTPYPTPDLLSGQTAPGAWSYWNAWSWASGVTPSYTLSSPVQSNGNAYYSNIMAPVQSAGGNPGIIGFFDRKGLDTTLDNKQLVGIASGAKSWWSPMRYAELILNFGECANELGKSNEALSVLYQIRQRANIAPGTSANYGITAFTQSDIRNAYIL